MWSYECSSVLPKPELPLCWLAMPWITEALENMAEIQPVVRSKYRHVCVSEKSEGGREGERIKIQ